MKFIKFTLYDNTREMLINTSRIISVTEHHKNKDLLVLCVEGGLSFGANNEDNTFLVVVNTYDGYLDELHKILNDEG
jgi:predicted small secreted protein